MADEDAEQGMEERAEPVVASGPPGVLRDRYVVQSALPLFDLSNPWADAFVAEDKKEPNRKLYALVCKRGLPPRISAMRILKGLSLMGFTQLVEWGPMSWPSASRQCMTVIYERPMGKRVMATMRAEFSRIEEHEISRRVVEPLLSVMKEMSSKGITHRAIRPTNLFFMDERGDRIALGDCVSAPAAIDQPLVFEPVESGMCSPHARGQGDELDDMYALGATIGFLLLGRNPVAHLDDAAILRHKLEWGSYSTIVGDTRLPLPLVELLRGLLCDDVKLRWDAESLDMWVQGRRLSPIQTRPEKRAPRAFPFQGKEYLTGRELAAGLAQHWEAAKATVLEGKLELWLRRAVEDKERAEAVASEVKLALVSTQDRKGAEDVMLAKILMILDPHAPIRYKTFATMPDGIGVALAVQMFKDADCKLLAEMILRDVPKAYFAVQGAQREDPLVENNFREIKNLLGQTGMGYGLERILYELNDSLPCQSPLVGESYVVEMKELLPGLDSYGHKGATTKQWPVDRHVAAFMGARARSDIDRNLAALSEGDDNKKLMSLMNLLAVFQYRLGPESMPGLAAWVSALASTMVSGYHGRDKRKELEKEIPRMVKRGSVVEIYQLLDDPTSKEKDNNDFAWAQAQYHAAEEEIKRIQTEDGEMQEDTAMVGKQFAAVAGILVGMFTIIVVVILKLW